MDSFARLNSSTHAGDSEKTVKLEALWRKFGSADGNAKKQWTMKVSATFDLWGVIGQSDTPGSSAAMCSNLQVRTHRSVLAFLPSM